METPPRPGIDPQSPTERVPRITPEPTAPIPRVETGVSDTTVVDVTPPPVPGDGRPPRMPWYMLALMAAVITLAIFWWFTQMQQEAQVQINATVTTATGATATVEAATTAAAVSQATTTAAQALAQQTAVAQATAAAQGVAAANATIAAQAAGAEQARATAEAIAAQANAAAEATRNAPTPRPAATPTPVVVVVTATSPPAAPTVPPAPVVVPEVPPPGPASSPAPSAPGPAAASPAAVAAKPAAPPAAPAVPAASSAGPVTATAAAGHPTQLQCLDNRVKIEADPGALPAGATLACRPVEPPTVPAPPGPVVGGVIFRLDASPGEGGKLPGLVTLEVTYPADAVAPADRARVTLGYLDGSEWKPVPEQDADPAAQRISALVERPGVYALYRRP